MIGKLRDLTINRDKTQNVTVTVGADFREMFDCLKDKQVDITIKPHREKRSKSANDFCWALCTDIGNAMHPPIPKEEVYRRAIKDVGEYEPLPIKDEAVESFLTRWAYKGIGWFAEVVDDSKLKGYKLVFAYYGSSTYSKDAMSRLIDYLVQDAEQMGVFIPMGKTEIEQMKGEWKCRTA